MQIFKIINGIDVMNCVKFFKFIDYDCTRDSYNKLYMFLLKHRVK